MKKTIFKRWKQSALIMIILCNIATLRFVAPLKENLSYLGNELGHPYFLMVWGSSAALYFYIYTSNLMKRTRYQNQIGKLFLFIACSGMILSVILPYAPNTLPQVSKWHIRIAMWSTALYVALFFHYLYDVMKKDHALFEKSMPFYSMLVVFDLLLFMFYGSVSTLLEITFTIGMALLLYRMDRIAS